MRNAYPWHKGSSTWQVARVQPCSTTPPPWKKVRLIHFPRSEASCSRRLWVTVFAPYLDAGPDTRIFMNPKDGDSSCYVNSLFFLNYIFFYMQDWFHFFSQIGCLAVLERLGSVSHDLQFRPRNTARVFMLYFTWVFPKIGIPPNHPF